MKSNARREKLRKSLLKQLKDIGADLPHFVDMVERYMDLWDISEALKEDIQERGTKYQDCSSTGVLMWKNNPSVKEQIMVSRQMMQILKDLNLTTDNLAKDDALPPL